MGLIRILLALAVADFHSHTMTLASHVLDLGWVNGEIAVETFFVISGFYMALILSGKYADKGVLSFYRSRFLRLYPGYWLACIMTIIVLFTTQEMNLTDYWQDLFYRHGWSDLAWNLVLNVFFFGQDWTMLIDRGHFHYLWIPQAWTLSIEVTFYVVAPWLIRRRTATLATLAGISLLARGALFRAGIIDYEASCYLSPLELLWFLLGMLSYRAYARWAAYLQDAGLGLILAACVAAMIIAFPQTIGVHFDLGQGWGAAGNYVLQLATALALPFIFATTRNSRVDALVGELSYPLYLCHVAVLEYVISLAVGLYRGELIMGASILLAIAIAVVLSPVERWRAWLSERVRITDAGSDLGGAVGARAGR
jgi:peptidoglycan/LPS O-acetylase OafA/YrhL